MIVIGTKLEKLINAAGRIIKSPEQRFVTGVTAFALQPLIDLHNKRVDDDTKTLAVSKSLAKGIAGTTSGVMVRKACIDFCNNHSLNGNFLDPMKNVTRKAINECKKQFPDAIENNRLKISYLNKYSNFIGNIMAIMVLLATNFLWDAPVTKRLTNVFYKFFTGKEPK